MTTLNPQFEKFLNNIEPDEKAIEYAQTAHQPVRDYLEDDDEFGEYFENSFLYGSYKRHTAVGQIKDIDIVVLTNFDPADPAHSPSKVLRKLKTVLAGYYKDPDNPEYQRRSIRINQPLPENADSEMTLDIIPAVALDGQDKPLLVPDKEVKKWIWSHPKGHIEKTTKLNKTENSEERFVPLVKIMKWWWKYQCEVRQPDNERPKPKGFWIEVLTGENFDPSKHDWADHYIAVLNNISKKYANCNYVPELQDPGLPNQCITTSMTLDEFKVFMCAINECLEQARIAYLEPDNLKSSELWRKIFGEEFPLFETEDGVDQRVQANDLSLGSCKHVQLPRWPNGIREKYKVHIDAYLYDTSAHKRFSGLNTNGRVIQSELWIKYVANTNIKGNFEVYWQVVNTGKHAEMKNGLRGNFFQAKTPRNIVPQVPLVNWEYTEFTGKHWIECFIVKDGVLVARSGRFFVNIKNPHY